MSLMQIKFLLRQRNTTGRLVIQPTITALVKVRHKKSFSFFSYKLNVPSPFSLG